MISILMRLSPDYIKNLRFRNLNENKAAKDKNEENIVNFIMYVIAVSCFVLHLE